VMLAGTVSIERSGQHHPERHPHMSFEGVCLDQFK
jgi:hypothetical protein